MNHLLDANALIALLDPDHADHDRVHRYFARRRFGVSPQVQLAALRHATRPVGAAGPRVSPEVAHHKLRVTMNTRGKFVPDELDAAQVPFDQVRGHRQWNDHYLAALARHHGLRLATCDEAIPAAFPDSAVLIPA